MNRITIYKNDIFEVQQQLHSEEYDIKHTRQCAGRNIDGDRCRRKIVRLSKNFYKGQHIDHIIDVFHEFNPLRTYFCNHHVYTIPIPQFLNYHFTQYAQRFIDIKRKKDILMDCTPLPVELTDIILSYCIKPIVKKKLIPPNTQ